jgi:hypothetical protein
VVEAGDSEPFSSCLLRELGKREGLGELPARRDSSASLWLSGAMPDHGGDGITDWQRTLEPGWLVAVHRKTCFGWRSGS